MVKVRFNEEGRKFILTNLSKRQVNYWATEKEQSVLDVESSVELNAFPWISIYPKNNHSSIIEVTPIKNEEILELPFSRAL
jgi:hypothetical protein